MNNKKKQPIPQGKYVPAVRHSELIFTSGMTPRKAGKLIYQGQIKLNDPIELYKEAVRQATSNALIAAQSCLNDGENIIVILQLNVYLNAEKGFGDHAKIADYASEVIVENLGPNCIGSRAAIGVASLPSDAPVEIVLTAKVV